METGKLQKKVTEYRMPTETELRQKACKTYWNRHGGYVLNPAQEPLCPIYGTPWETAAAPEPQG